LKYQFEYGKDTIRGMHQRYGTIFDDKGILDKYNFTIKDKTIIVEEWFNEHYPEAFHMWFYLRETSEEGIYDLNFGWDSGD